MSTDQIRRVVATDDGIELETISRPRPAPGEALVSLRAAGVCGSDLHAVRGKHPFVPLPYLPGHEVVGLVTAVGDGADESLVGRRVVVEPTLPCWYCRMCLDGRENLCENLQFFGCGYSQGGMADAFSVAADRLHLVPDQLDDRAAALIEPLSTPVHAARLAGSLTGKTVVILGAGTIGLLLLSVVRAQDASKIVVTDIRRDKLELASRLGADDVVDAGDPALAATVRGVIGGSADVVFDCVAIQSTVSTAIALADKGGRVVIVGVPAAEVQIPLPLVQDHQIDIQGSATYLPVDFAESIAMLTGGAVDVDALITAQFPLERAAEAFRVAGEGSQIKVIVTADR